MTEEGHNMFTVVELIFQECDCSVR